MKSVKAGKLRHRIAIQSHSGSQDTFGEYASDSWATDATVWGSVTSLSGKELERAKQKVENVSHEIMIRGGTTVTSDNQIVFDSRTFSIGTVFDDSDEIGIIQKILCTELK